MHVLNKQRFFYSFKLFSAPEGNSQGWLEKSFTVIYPCSGPASSWWWLLVQFVCWPQCAHWLTCAPKEKQSYNQYNPPHLELMSGLTATLPGLDRSWPFPWCSCLLLKWTQATGANQWQAFSCTMSARVKTFSLGKARMFMQMCPGWAKVPVVTGSTAPIQILPSLNLLLLCGPSCWDKFSAYLLNH